MGGGFDYYFEHGVVVPDDYLEQLCSFDAIFLSAVGDPERLPDSTTLAPLVQIRQRFDQYVCMRPARLFRGVDSPLANPRKNRAQPSGLLHNNQINRIVTDTQKNGAHAFDGERTQNPGRNLLDNQNAFRDKPPKLFRGVSNKRNSSD